MVLANGSTPPPLISSLDTFENVVVTTSKNTASQVVSAHYKPKVSRNDQMEQHKKLHASDSQYFKADW